MRNIQLKKIEYLRAMLAVNPDPAFNLSLREQCLQPLV